jgi:hypothetical protein
MYVSPDMYVLPAVPVDPPNRTAMPLFKDTIV